MYHMVLIAHDQYALIVLTFIPIIYAIWCLSYKCICYIHVASAMFACVCICTHTYLYSMNVADAICGICQLRYICSL